MEITRRQALSGLAAIGATAVSAGSGAAHVDARGSRPAAAEAFPRKADFAFADGVTYINGAFTHPMPMAAAEAYQAAVRRRSTVGGPFAPTADVRPLFAALVNAKPSEIGFIPNTSTGENFVVESLGLVPGRDNVVTDGLHFEGALVHLMERRKRGLDVRVVMPRDGRIQLADLERAIDRRTKLVEVSFVAMYNGFQHDLKAVCDLAHAHGAYVYADIIQGVGAVPLDVRAIGLDFAATSTYKWLMGDFGLGFMFVREDLLDRVVRRPHWSYESAPDVEFHWSPFDPPITPGHQLHAGEGRRHVPAARDRRQQRRGRALRVAALPPAAGHRADRAAPHSAPQAAPGRDAAAGVHAADAAGEHRADRDVRARGPRRHHEEAAGREGRRAGGAVLDPDRAVRLQRHDGHRAIAGGPVLGASPSGISE